MSLPLSFKPEGEFELLRIGPNEDGGYLVGKNLYTIQKIS